ncbi:caveolin-1-like [Amphiura filiformis]|uniref:caveolin-1-like n=1 Tax=Amphiura filiformis TaxID=82378 RepID=UPI003B20F48A
MTKSKITANMNNTLGNNLVVNSNKDTYLHEDEAGDHSTPLLHATDLEAPAASSRSQPGYTDGTATEEHHVHHEMPVVHVMEANQMFDFSGHVDCTFAKVFPEARGTHSVEAVSRCMNSIFSLTQQITYMILTVFIATFLAFIWGIIFAVCNFIIIWLLQPVVKLLFLFIRLLGDIARVIIKSVAQPLFQAISAVCSNYRGNFNVNVAAQEPLTTDDLPLHPV